jgi:hypothetical protein
MNRISFDENIGFYRGCSFVPKLQLHIHSYKMSAVETAHYVWRARHVHMLTVSKTNNKDITIEASKCHNVAPAAAAVLRYRQSGAKVHTLTMGATYTASCSCGCVRVWMYECECMHCTSLVSFICAVWFII